MLYCVSCAIREIFFVSDTLLPRFEALAYDLPHTDALTHVVILVSAAFIFQSGLLRSDVLRKAYIDLCLLNRPKRSSLLLKFTLD